MQEFISHSAEETSILGERFAREYLMIGSVVTVRGELGAGKTQFTKGIARTLGIDERDISSPTFALANEYPALLPDGTPVVLYHLDCYRFEKPEELLELGVEEYLYPKNGLCVIEWPERIEEYLPKERIEVVFEWISDSERRIRVLSS